MNKPTQQQWADALVDAWLARASIGMAVGKAFQLEGKVNENEVWDEIRAHLQTLTPRVTPRMALKQSVMPFIARFAYYANEALWNGQIDRARGLIARGGVLRKSEGEREREQSIKDVKKEASRNRFISERSRTKKHDWSTTK